MCGILVTRQSYNPTDTLKFISSRGPDAYKKIVFDDYQFHFFRLAIVALGEAGTQPYEDDDVIVLFNGELYGWDKSFGSEVKWLAYLAKEFTDFPRLLNGQYFIVVYHKKRKSFLLLRDPLGIIPGFFKAKDEGDFVICSEDVGNCQQVFPGELVVLAPSYPTSNKPVHNMGISVVRNYFAPMLDNRPFDQEAYIAVLLETVDLVLSHSDVPVSFALGGVDSMLLLAACHRLGKKPNEVFTVGFSQYEDDLLNAREFCRKFDFNLREVILDRNEIDDLIPKLSARMQVDLKQNSVKLWGALRAYMVARSASNKVILCGDGADELFYGYPYFNKFTEYHLTFKGWKALQSMHKINLDRTDRMGMMCSREFRPVYLERHHVNWVLQRKRSHNKIELRTVAETLGVPKSMTYRPKWGSDEAKATGLTT